MAQDLSIRLRVEGRDGEGAVRRLSSEFTGLQSSIERTARASASATASLARMGHAAAALASINITAKGIQQTVDAWSSLNAQLSIATGSAQAGAKAYSEVLRIATSTGQSLEQIGTVFRRFSENAGSLGISMEQVASVSETVAKALALSGGSAESAQAALVQFGQALASGQLRGEELNSVLEQAPRLAKALADGLGVPVGRLRALAEAGDLTSEALVDALGQAAESVAAEFDQLPVTIGRSLQNVQTAFIDVVGSFEKSTGLFQLAAGGINAVAQHMDVLAASVGTLSAVLVGRLVGGIAASIRAKAADAAATIRAQQATVAATAASQTFAAAKLAEAQASIAAASGMQRLALVQSQLIPAQNALTQATVAATAARTAASTAANVGRVALGALGGPIGIVTTALTLGVTAWALWGNKAESATKQAADAATEHVATVLNKLREMDARIGSFTRRQVEASIQNAMDARTENAIEQDMRERRVRELREAVNRGQELGGFHGIGLDKKIAQLREEEGKYQAAVSRGAELQRTYESLSAQRVNAGIEDVRRFTAEHATGAAKVRAEKERVLADFATVIGNSARGALDLSIPEHKAAFEALNGQLAEIDRRAKKADGSLSGAAAAKRAAAAEAKTLAAIQAEAAGLTASFYEEWDALTRAFRAGKFGTGEDAVRKLTAAQGALLAQQPAIRNNLEAEARAARTLSQWREGLASTAKRQSESLADATERMREEIATMGMSAEELGKYEAAKLQAAAAAHTQAAAELEAAAALLDAQGVLPEVARGYRDLAEARRKAAAELGDQAELTLQRSLKQVEIDQQEAAKNSAAIIEQSLTDALLRGFESGEGFAKNLAQTTKNLFSTLVLRPIIQAVVQPVAGQITGMLGLGGQGGAGGGLGGIGNVSSLAGLIGGGVTQDPIAQLLGHGVAQKLGPGAGAAGLLSAGASLFSGTALGSFGAGMAGGVSAFGSLSQMAAVFKGGAAAGGAVGAGMIAGTVLPVIGAVAGIASALGAFKGPSYHSGAAVEYGTDNRVRDLRHKDTVGDTRVWGGFSETDQKGGAVYRDPLKELSKSATDSFEKFMGQFGHNQQISAYAAFGADGKDASRGQLRLYDAEGNLLGANSDQLLRGKKYDKDAQKGFQQFAGDVGTTVRDALVEADLPGWVDSVLTSLGDSVGLDQLNAVMADLETIQGKTMDADARWRKVTTSMADQFASLGVQMPESTAAFNELLRASGDLAGELYQLAPAFYELAGVVEGVFASISATTAAGVRDIEMAMLDDAGKYSYLDREIEGLLQKLAEAQDPAKVQSLFEQANEKTLQAFSLLDAGERQRLGTTYIDRLHELEALAQERLSVVPDDYQPALAAADSQQSAAERTAAAADSLADAADRLSEAVARFGAGTDGGADALRSAAAELSGAAQRLGGAASSVSSLRYSEVGVS